MPVSVHGDDGSLYRKHFVGTSMWKRVEAGRTTWFLPGVRIEHDDGEDADEVRVFYGSFAERDPDGALHFHVTDHVGSVSLVAKSATISPARSRRRMATTTRRTSLSRD